MNRAGKPAAADVRKAQPEPVTASAARGVIPSSHNASR